MTSRPCDLTAVLQRCRRRAAHLGLVLIASISFLWGCSSWRTHEVAQTLPEITSGGHDRIRVTMKTGERVVILDPRVDADRISGHTEAVIMRDYHERRVPGAPISVTLGELDRIELRGLDYGRSALVILGSSAVVVAGYYLVLYNMVANSDGSF